MDADRQMEVSERVRNGSLDFSPSIISPLWFGVKYSIVSKLGLISLSADKYTQFE